MKNSKNNHTIVAKELSNELIRDISGQNDGWLFGKIPCKNVMVGMIDSRESGDEFANQSDSKREDMFKSIPSIGIRFKIKKTTEVITFSISGKLFYRTRPTFEQQEMFSIQNFNKKYNEIVSSTSELIELISKKSEDPNYVEPNEEIVRINKSISLDNFGQFELSVSNIEQSLDLVNEKIENKLDSVIGEIANESVLYREHNVKIRELLNKDRYLTKISAYENIAIPAWKIKIYATVEKRDDYNEVFVQLVNHTQRISRSGGYETAIFNGGLSVSCESGFEPYSFNEAKYDYIDNPLLPAIGNNCSVFISDDGKKLTTDNIPVHYQHRVITNDQFNSYIEFQKLIDDPVGSLTFIAQEMNKKLDSYNWQLQVEKSNKPEEYIEKFQEEIESFKFEVKRFRDGIELIKNNTHVRTAFELMNRTFSINTKGYKGWRMFQIVFVVSLLKDMVNCEYENTRGFTCNDINNVDLIYFPTGGGKTETFLGCVAFSAFFDRIRGKNDGVTSIIKYPLRLLASQQLDRILDLTINANIIKRQFNIGGDDFTVGLFTGKDNTPNRMDYERVQNFETLSTDMANEMYRQISVCPICQRKGVLSPLNVSFDKNRWLLKHVCSNPNCQFELPLYIVDDEIYRFTPTFVISTIDKMANMGISPGFNSLLGQSEIKCPQHGFVPYGKKCLIQGCKCQLDYDIQRKDPVPTLFIQDEMHLVSESLGTFDSHYESLINYYCEKLVPANKRKKIKYIGATATISDFEEHIRNLYNKNAKKFPVSVKKENFYSKIDKDDISRIIIGAALYGDSITDNIRKIVTFMRVIVSEWIKDSTNRVKLLKEKGFEGDSKDLEEVLNDYLIEIVYNTSKRDAGNVYTSLEDIGNNYLMSKNIPTFNIAEISNDVDFRTITEIMHDIESEHDKYKTKNVIIATSSISHGVDEDCFNQIFFFGVPPKTAEYVQAFSRVGRKYTGIVFDVFRLIRDRDKSYLKNFTHYHNYMDILINSVPINRYAKNAIHSTLPGIVSSLLTQHYIKNDISSGGFVSANLVSAAIRDGRLKEEELIKNVKEIYDCEHNDSKLYSSIIENEVHSIFKGFSDNNKVNLSISELIPKFTSKNKEVMTSLRDVDVALEIDLKGGRY